MEDLQSALFQTVTRLNYNGANGRQRKALRVAITVAFNKRTLRRFLDEELELNLDDLAAEDDFSNTVWELIQKLRARGLIDTLIQKWFESDEFGTAPVLSDLRQNWPLLSDQGGGTRGAAIAGAGSDGQLMLPRFKQFGGAERAFPVVSARSGDNRQKGDLESILDDKVDRMPAVAWMKGLAALSRQVCTIQADRKPIATGFLVGPRHVMTAAHVAHYLFDRPGPFEAVFDQGDTNSLKKIVRIDHIIAADPKDLTVGDTPRTDWFQSLDFALLELAEEAPQVDGGPRGWIDLTDYRSRLHPGEAVVALYYPGTPSLTISQGSVGNPPALSGRFGHDARTRLGASGGPIFDARLKLVGFHESRIPEAGRKEEGNYAVRADAIARELEARGIKLPKPPAQD